MGRDRCGLAAYRVCGALLLAGACGSRSGLTTLERAHVQLDAGVRDAQARDAADGAGRDGAADLDTTTRMDAPEQACVWRIVREAPIDPDGRLGIFSPSISVAANNDEVWIGLVAGASPRRLELVHLGVDGMMLAPPVVIHTLTTGVGYFSVPQIALDVARRAVTHVEGFADCQFIRFLANGSLATPVLLGRGNCTQLHTTSSGFALWAMPNDQGDNVRVTLDNLGAVTSRITFAVPSSPRASVELADGAILVLWVESRTVGQYALVMQRFAVDGTPAAPATELTGRATWPGFASWFTPSPEGYALAWVEVTDTPGVGAVMLARLDVRGVLVGVPENLGVATCRANFGCGVTLAVSRGSVLVAWPDRDARGMARIAVQPVPLDGSSRPPRLTFGTRLDPRENSAPIQIVATSIGALLTAAIDTDATTTPTVVALACD